MKIRASDCLLSSFLILILQIRADEATPRLLSESEATAIVEARETAKEARYQAQVQELGVAEVVDSKVVQSGSGSLIINVVKSLVLTKPTEEPATEIQSELTAPEFTAILAEQQSTLSEQISMGANVYGNEYSEITWRDTETHAVFTAWTNVSLNYLRPITSVQSEGYDYTYFGFVTNYHITRGKLCA